MKSIAFPTLGDNWITLQRVVQDYQQWDIRAEVSTNLDLSRYPSLPKLDANLSRFERALVAGVVDTLLSHFIEKGADAEGLRLRLSDGTRLGIRYEYQHLKRTLDIHLFSDRRQQSAVTDELQINRVGAISTIKIRWPMAVARRNKKLLDAISRFTNERYIELREHYLSESQRARIRFGGDVWAVLRGELEKHSLSSLIPSLSVTATDLNTMQFRYVFDDEAARNALQRLERTQGFYSPVEMALSLQLEEIGHTLNSRMRDYTDGALLSLPCSEFVSFGENLKVYEAECALLDDRELVDFNVCRSHDTLLQIGVPASAAGVAEPALKSARSEVERRFELSRRRYARFFRDFRALPEGQGRLSYNLGQYTAGLADGVIKILTGEA